MRKFGFFIVVCILIFLLVPFGYGLLRSSLQSASLSWVFMEWFYYVLLILMGAALVALSPLKWSKFSFWKRALVGSVLVVFPFLVGFIQHPIYEDMLWDLSQDMSMLEATVDYQESDLVVIAIADCPYCKRAITEMKALHDRNPQLRMRMVVCTADSTWLIPYAEEADGAFEVVMAENMDVLATQAGGHFPAYVLVRDGKPERRWTNNEWGPVAKDIVEETTRY
jgi:hypothetical protein